MVSELRPSKTHKSISLSGLVTSTQRGIHPRLETCVRRHLETPWSQPLHRPSLEAFKYLERERAFSDGQMLILDSGCGTGKSTQRLAAMFPGQLVIGVDRSISRLAKSGVTSNFLRSENFILLRSELTTFWRLLLQSGRPVERHFLFYPNPWPKPGHLLRRWHGHPVFPQLLALGGEIELRSNWEIYAGEFAQATRIATGASINVENIQPEKAISPFEEKYLERGQSLFSVKVHAQALKAFRGSWLGHESNGLSSRPYSVSTSTTTGGV